MRLNDHYTVPFHENRITDILVYLKIVVNYSARLPLSVCFEFRVKIFDTRKSLLETRKSLLDTRKSLLDTRTVNSKLEFLIRNSKFLTRNSKLEEK